MTQELHTMVYMMRAMSIFSFFAKKKPLALDSSARKPLTAVSNPASIPRPPESRRSERLEQRELLYGAVRDVMIRAGVLAASYKFKVLSQDARGRQYLIMMDLKTPVPGGVIRLAEIEVMMVQTAKVRHGILVNGVYWRTEDSAKTSSLAADAPNGAPSFRPPDREPVPRAGTPTPGYEPLQQSEVDAFKQALVTQASKKVAQGVTVTSGRRRAQPSTDFEETHMEPTADSASPLSITQYGDLN
jgi:hypothetical protein